MDDETDQAVLFEYKLDFLLPKLHRV
jgi:hypothetical protein